MKPIPIVAGRDIAEKYGYDQVVIIARKVGENGGEHVTTYGRDKAHCDVAARMGNFFKHKLMGWPNTPPTKSDDLTVCDYCGTWRSKPCGEGCYWNIAPAGARIGLGVR